MRALAACRRILGRLRNALFPWRDEAELSRELAAHVSLLEDDYRRRGLSAEDARVAARRAMGGIEQAKELHREARSFTWIDDARRDAWQTLRSLNRHRAFAAVAILTLAIGLGANTALFSAFNAIVLRPLPYHEPDQLVVVTPPVFAITSARAFEALQQNAKQVRALTGFVGPGAATLMDHGTPTGVDYADVRWNFLSFLGTPPAIGRDFTEADARPGAARVALLTYDFWLRRFGGDPSIVNRTLTVDNWPLTIVGVTSPGFRFPVTGLRPATGMVESLQPGLLRVAPASNPLTVLGRLAPGATPASAAAELQAIYRDTDLAQVRAPLRDWAKVTVGRLHERLAGDLRRWLLLVMATVALVLLVASANVANLLLARASSRQRELAVRTAVGAPLSRLVRMTLTESLVLSAIGAVLGLLIAWWGATAARPLLADRMPHVSRIGIDWTVFLFAAALAIATGVACGIASALSVRRLDVAAAFNDSGTPAMSGRSRMRQFLLSAEAGFTFVLVIGAVLMAQTFRNLETKDRGFDTRDALTLRLSPGPAWRGAARDLPTVTVALADYMNSVRDQVGALPGIASVALVTNAPLGPLGFGFGDVVVKGLPPPEHRDVSALFVTPGYFATIRTPILQGREFFDTDTARAEPVIIVNEAFQRQFAASRSLMGAQVLANNRPLIVVGVAHDVPGNTLRDEVRPAMYVPLAQSAATNMLSAQMTMVVRTLGVPPATIVPGLRSAIWALDRSAVLADITTLDDRVAASLRTERQSAIVFTALALIALVIAAIGVYGVATYAVAQRTKELGIRITLGANRRDIVGLVLRQAVTPALVGIGLGVPVAAASTRLLASMLYGVTALDAGSFAAAAAVLVIAALAAMIAPTRRVLRLDPLVALRMD